MKRRVNVGEDFDAEIRFIEASTKARAEATRQWIAKTVLGTCALFLIGTAVLGFVEGSFEKLRDIWGAAGIPVGMIVGYYFTRKGKDE